MLTSGKLSLNLGEKVSILSYNNIKSILLNSRPLNISTMSIQCKYSKWNGCEEQVHQSLKVEI